MNVTEALLTGAVLVLAVASIFQALALRQYHRDAQEVLESLERMIKQVRMGIAFEEARRSKERGDHGPPSVLR